MSSSSDLLRVFGDFVRAETRLYNAIDDRLKAELDTNLGRYEMLEYIAANANCRVHDIADEFAITIGAASKAVDRIEEAGYCSRSVNPLDRRSSHLVLTTSGQRLSRDARRVFDDEVHRRLDHVLSADRLHEFGAAVAALRRALEQDGTTGGTGRQVR